MTLALGDQYRMAQVQEDFLNIVTAAVFNTAIEKFSADVLTDPVAQGQRLTLANEVTVDPSVATRIFAWLVVSRPALMEPADLDDTTVLAIVAQFFDQVAQLLIPIPVAQVTP